MTVTISRCVVDIIQRAAINAAPLEACGLLFGTAGCVDDCLPCRNVADQPDVGFEIDPAALIAAHRAERAGGRGIVGCFHSHPSGDVSPSARDAQAAEANGWVWLIVGNDAIGAYRAVADGPIHGRFAALGSVV